VHESNRNDKRQAYFKALMEVLDIHSNGSRNCRVTHAYCCRSGDRPHRLMDD
jgi:hypothetical protein